MVVSRVVNAGCVTETNCIAHLFTECKDNPESVWLKLVTPSRSPLPRIVSVFTHPSVLSETP